MPKFDTKFSNGASCINDKSPKIYMLRALVAEHIEWKEKITIYNNRNVPFYFTLQEHQRIRTFAIFQKFLTLKIVWWSMEKFTFSSIQPISVKISGKYIYKNLIIYGDPTYIETFMDPIRMIQIFMVFHQLLILSPI